jgi:hypothetical protein
MWLQFISPHSLDKWIHSFIHPYSLQPMNSLFHSSLFTTTNEFTLSFIPIHYNQWIHSKSSEITWRKDIICCTEINTQRKFLVRRCHPTGSHKSSDLLQTCMCWENKERERERERYRNRFHAHFVGSLETRDTRHRKSCILPPSLVLCLSTHPSVTPRFIQTPKTSSTSAMWKASSWPIKLLFYIALNLSIISGYLCLSFARIRQASSKRSPFKADTASS